MNIYETRRQKILEGFWASTGTWHFLGSVALFPGLVVPASVVVPKNCIHTQSTQKPVASPFYFPLCYKQRFCRAASFNAAPTPIYIRIRSVFHATTKNGKTVFFLSKIFI
jgi:hypothetical protein